MESWATKGLFFYNMETGEIREHANKTLAHLYSLCWSPDGNYLTATVLGGDGFRHTDVGIEINSTKYFQLNITGCRPEFSPEGDTIGWGKTDREFDIAKIYMNRKIPVSEKDKIPFLQVAEGYKVYHLDWSPDGRYIAFSYGNGEGQQHVGGTARGWEYLHCGDCDRKMDLCNKRRKPEQGTGLGSGRRY